jgi:hypothetical protein
MYARIVSQKLCGKPDRIRSDNGPLVRLDNKPRNLFAPNVPMRESFRELVERWLVTVATATSAGPLHIAYCYEPCCARTSSRPQSQQVCYIDKAGIWVEGHPSDSRTPVTPQAACNVFPLRKRVVHFPRPGHQSRARSRHHASVRPHLSDELLRSAHL